jgi:hypothetical protein
MYTCPGYRSEVKLVIHLHSTITSPTPTAAPKPAPTLPAPAVDCGEEPVMLALLVALVAVANGTLVPMALAP